MNNLYCIYDKKAGNYYPPNMYINDDVAIRDLAMMISKNDFMSANASDYQLLRIGTYDDTTATITNDDNVVICELNSLIEV